MSEQAFELKGNLFTLSVLNVFNNDAETVLSQLAARIQDAPQFFSHAPVVVNLAKVADDFNLAALFDGLKQLALNPVGVCHGSAELQHTAKALGYSVLHYTQDAPKPAPKAAPVAAKPRPENTSIVEKVVHLPAQIVNGTVRSGQQIYAKDRDLIVIGSVSHGAEVIADGNVHIYGTLRGRAAAGAKGQADAFVFCHKLEAELVSVNGHYYLSESLQGSHWSHPAKITANGDSLVISALV